MKIFKKFFNDDKSVEILERIISKNENPLVNGLWTGQSYKIATRGHRQNDEE